MPKLPKENIDLQTLEKIYIEPTNTCNLWCKTCVRNIWDESDCFMSKKTFENILKSISQIFPLPTVFFGGFGGPLNHPDILDMIAELKKIKFPCNQCTACYTFESNDCDCFSNGLPSCE